MDTTYIYNETLLVAQTTVQKVVTSTTASDHIYIC